jgi:hypothetical protein
MTTLPGGDQLIYKTGQAYEQTPGAISGIRQARIRWPDLLRPYSMLAVMLNVFLGFHFKCLAAGSGAKIVGFAVVNRLLDGAYPAHPHTANRIYEATFIFLVFHCYLLKYLTNTVNTL